MPGQNRDRPPPRGPRPPYPPGGEEPDPADQGPPIPVRLDAFLLGDLGNARVDARLVSAILVRDGRVAEWLRHHGVEVDALDQAFPGSKWG